MPFSSGTFTSGAKSDIGTSAVQITTSDIPCIFGVLVKTDSANTGIIYVGPKEVTAETADATDGYKLRAGEEISTFIPVDNANKVYVIADIAGQKVWWLAV